jgi:hypothetical protein
LFTFWSPYVFTYDSSCVTVCFILIFQASELNPIFDNCQIFRMLNCVWNVRRQATSKVWIYGGLACGFHEYWFERSTESLKPLNKTLSLYCVTLQRHDPRRVYLASHWKAVFSELIHRSELLRFCKHCSCTVHSEMYLKCYKIKHK